MLADAHVKAVHRVVRVAFAHQQRQGQHVGLLAVGLVVSSGVVVKLDAFNSIAGDEHVDLRQGAEDSSVERKVDHGATDVPVPLIGGPELLVLVQLELI